MHQPQAVAAEIGFIGNVGNTIWTLSECHSVYGLIVDFRCFEGYDCLLQLEVTAAVDKEEKM